MGAPTRYLKIESFKGDYEFLSNFFPARVEYDERWYPSVEHAYQAAKTLDKNFRKQFRTSRLSAGGAKSMGRRVKLRDDWEEVKLEIMRELLIQKFTLHRELREKLIATGERQLIEGNWWGDTFWGVCRGKGENWLGKLLMEVRKECT